MLESKRRAIIFIMISLLLALTAGFLVMKKVGNLNDNLGTMVNVYVAKEAIPSRTLIKPSDVMTIEIPKRYLEDYHVTDTEDLMNQVSVIPLSNGDLIMKGMLKQVSNVRNEKNRLINLMGSDRVNFDEPLEESERVDIIVSHKFNGKEETSIFMQDVKVASVAKAGKAKTFKGVWLEVPLEQAPKLIHMQNYADSVRILKANVGKGPQAEAVKEETPPVQVPPPPATTPPAVDPAVNPDPNQAAAN